MADEESNPTATPKPPRVFISYSHDSDEHAERILELADWLNKHGVEAIIDQYTPVPKEGWPHWMEENLDAADFVLMACTETYFRRVMGREKPGVGKGVRWEGNLIYNRLYHGGPLGDRYLPILLDGGLLEHIPGPTQGHTFFKIHEFDLSDSQFELLYRHLTGRHRIPKPAIGAITDIPIRDPNKAPKSTPHKSEPIWNIPHPRNLYFTGRKEILRRIHETLTFGETAAINQPAAISGLGGLGKTQTAVEYAYRHKGEYKAVLWTQADSEKSLRDGLAKLAVVLDLPLKDAQDQSEVLNAVLRSLKAESNWLLILDNVDDLNDVKRYLLGLDTGHVLITTRLRVTGSIAKALPLDLLSEEEGALFLLQRAEMIQKDQTIDVASAADQEAARKLSHDMQGLPLALDQAGACVLEMNSTLGDYQSRYAKFPKKVLDQRGELADHQSVFATFGLSLEQVEKKDPNAAELIRCCAFLNPDAIPEELFNLGGSELSDEIGSAAEDEILWDQIVSKACRFSLIQRDAEKKTLSIHRLVQAVIQHGMDDEARRGYAERTVRAVSQAFPYVEHSSWPLCERLLPDALVCFTYIAAYGFEFIEAARLPNQAGVYLNERARYSEAEPMYVRALGIREKALEPYHPDVATSLNNLAELYRNQGRYSDAEPLYVRTLEINEKALGPDHPNFAANLNNLAALYDDQGRYSEAEHKYLRALGIMEKALGSDHPNVAQSLNNLAVLYYNQGRHLDAEPLYVRTLEINEKALGPDHPVVARSLNNLAVLYYNQGRYSEAEPMYVRALGIYDKALGPNHPDVAASLSNLATLYRNQGRYSEAESRYLRALEINEKALGPEHPDVATSLSHLAELYRNQGQYSEAEPLYLRALSIAEKSLGADHPNTKVCRENLRRLREKMAE